MRYVLFRWTPTERAEEGAARAMAGRLGQGWRTLVDWRGVLLLAPEHEARAFELPNGRGAVLGEMWSGAELDMSTQEDSERSIADFARDRWGSYVALVIDKSHDVVRLLRSPDGAVPCFRTEREGVHIVFAEAADFIAMAPDVAPDLAFVAAFLVYPRVVLRRTGLCGVEEIAPGEAAMFTRTAARTEVFWAPMAHSRIETFAQGMCVVRSAAETVAGAFARRDGAILHRLSGGFDSTAVLGLLARAMPRERITCVNEYWPDAAEGDERPMARSVAGAMDVGLVELAMDPRRVDYDRTLSAPLTVKPTLSVLSFADVETARAYASFRADFLTSGRGGDHVFHRSRTPAIAADALRDGARGLITIALDTARLTRRSVWGVFQTMLWQGALRRPGLRLPRSQAASFLTEEFSRPDVMDHPWMELARAATPARAARLGHLRDALSYHDRSAATGRMLPTPLLLAQPVVDACLSVAPYVMTAGGADRALARAAFQDLTPPGVHGRTLKGETTRYFAAILQANLEWICDVLIDGELVRSGLVVRQRLERVLRADWRHDGAIADGLYSLVAAEAWLRNLAACKRRVSAYSAEAT